MTIAYIGRLQFKLAPNYVGTLFNWSISFSLPVSLLVVTNLPHAAAAQTLTLGGNLSDLYASFIAMTILL